MAPPLVFLLVLLAQSTAPQYTAASVVNSASNLPNLAPNTIICLYGRNFGELAYTPRSGSNLPLELGGVRVLLDADFGELIFVSPSQINFRLPARLLRPTVNLRVSRDGLTGPAVALNLQSEAPELYTANESQIIATFADGSVVSPEKPARPGDLIVLYGTGFGLTTRPGPGLAIAADPLVDPGRFAILVEGITLERSSIFYIGVTPGFGGLYQINLRLPSGTPANPEIRIVTPAHGSRAGLRLPFTPD